MMMRREVSERRGNESFMFKACLLSTFRTLFLILLLMTLLPCHEV